MSERDMRLLGRVWFSDPDSEVVTQRRWALEALNMVRFCRLQGYALVMPSVVTRSCPEDPTAHHVRAFAVPVT